ncbi:hypothetical protein MLD38_026390 [Melastoma candidum]|uniref:Uncharacterized protein n=1 Tax=Melastoma candidum TaxID=119954 RepID=A0ACB9NYF8_9MYRT|nr:hypothetical protein MLD38_026390 [Melastoma candidum]
MVFFIAHRDHQIPRGDFRLRKARSNDLFREAVWPRLLAKGWHSEQPKDHSVSGSRHSLGFLVPGIQEFSRDSLVKGNDYFDSVTDILNKVASDPALLELHCEAEDRVTAMEEFKHKTSTVSDMNEVIKRPSCHYLQPRISKDSFNSMMFMIVDTSLVRRGKSIVRELRHLPVELTGVLVNSATERDAIQLKGLTNHKLSCISKIEENVIVRGLSELSSCLPPDNADKTCPRNDVMKPKDPVKNELCLPERKPAKSLLKGQKKWELKSQGHSCDAGVAAGQQNSATVLPEQIKVESSDILVRKRHKSASSHCIFSPMKSKKMVLSLFASRGFLKYSSSADNLKDAQFTEYVRILFHHLEVTMTGLQLI